MTSFIAGDSFFHNGIIKMFYVMGFKIYCLCISLYKIVKLDGIKDWWAHPGRV